VLPFAGLLGFANSSILLLQGESVAIFYKREPSNKGVYDSFFVQHATGGSGAPLRVTGDATWPEVPFPRSGFVDLSKAGGIYTRNLITCAGIAYLYPASKETPSEFVAAALLHSNAGAVNTAFSPTKPADGLLEILNKAGADPSHAYAALSVADLSQKDCDQWLRHLKAEGLDDNRIVFYLAGQQSAHGNIGHGDGSFGVRKDGAMGMSIIASARPARATPTPKKHGCCYLTTATCEALGMDDNCRELTELRWFRDNILTRSEEGRAGVELYYRTAPAIVEAIARRVDAKSVYVDLYAKVIRPSAEAVIAGNYDEAYRLFRNMVFSYRERFTI
jgi:hypothetical protein